MKTLLAIAFLLAGCANATNLVGAPVTSGIPASPVPVVSTADGCPVWVFVGVVTSADQASWGSVNPGTFKATIPACMPDGQVYVTGDCVSRAEAIATGAKMTGGEIVWQGDTPHLCFSMNDAGLNVLVQP